MHRVLSFLLSLLFVVSAYAIPADPTPFRLKLSNGTEIMVRAVGDESFHYLVDMNGTPVVEDANGYRLAPEQKEELKEKLRTAFNERNAPLAAAAKSRMAKRRDMARRGIVQRFDKDKFTGHKKGIVILVDFPDRKMTATQVDYLKFFNQTGYSENGCNGSVRDFFYNNSNENLDIEFDVYGPVTVSEKESYYGKDENSRRDVKIGYMVEEACKKVNDQYDVDWSQYCWENPKEVSQVFLIHAGYDQAANSNTGDFIWSKMWNLTRAFLGEKDKGPLIIKDGIKIDLFATSAELRGSPSLFKSSKLTGIGTACHEFSHCLGFPDMYDTDNDGIDYPGMSYWSLMCSGNYNGKEGACECPSGYTAFERWYAGWLELSELSHDATVRNMPSIGSSTPTAYVIYKDDKKDEMIILENRQEDKWFKFLHKTTGCSGLLAYRVGLYDETTWNANALNNGEDQLITFIPANNVYDSNYNSHLFPNGSVALTSTSHTSVNGCWAKRGAATNPQFRFTIDNIRQTDGKLSFTFDNLDYEPSEDETDNTGQRFPTLKGLKSVRYWIDNATTAKETVMYLSHLNVNVSSLDEGIHTLYTQVTETGGYASDVVATSFYKLPQTTGMKYFYWIDGERNPKVMTTTEESQTIDMTAYADGIHTLYMQARNGAYQSDITTTVFYKAPVNPNNTVALVCVVDGKQISRGLIKCDGSVARMDLSTVYQGIEPGFHKLQMYVVNHEGAASDITECFFFQYPLNITDSKDILMLYSIDGGELKSYRHEVIPGANRTTFFNIPTAGLADGVHTIRYMLVSADLNSQKEGTAQFTVGSSKGDMNNDGKITIADVKLLAAACSNNINDPITIERGDMNDDNTITIADVTYLINYLFGTNAKLREDGAGQNP